MAEATPSIDMTTRRRRRWLGAARQRARDWGWRRAAWWQVMHGLRGLVRVHYVAIGADRPDIRSASPPPPLPPGYEARLGQRADFLPLVGRLPGIDAEFVDSAFARGDQCAVVLHEGEVVSYSFETRTRARVTAQLDVVIPPGFRYVYKSWTHPGHRRRHLSRHTSHVRQTRIPRPPAERSLSYVETHNYPSLLRGYRDPRDRPMVMGYSGWITVKGRQIPFNSRQARKLGFLFIPREHSGRFSTMW